MNDDAVSRYDWAASSLEHLAFQHVSCYAQGGQPLSASSFQLIHLLNIQQIKIVTAFLSKLLLFMEFEIICLSFIKQKIKVEPQLIGVMTLAAGLEIESNCRRRNYAFSSLPKISSYSCHYFPRVIFSSTEFLRVVFSHANLSKVIIFFPQT